MKVFLKIRNTYCWALRIESWELWRIFVKGQKREKENCEKLMIVSAIICTFSMNFLASYSLFVFSRTCVRISGSSQSHSFISSSRFLPATDSEKYISRLSVFPMKCWNMSILRLQQFRPMSNFYSRTTGKGAFLRWYLCHEAFAFLVPKLW